MRLGLLGLRADRTGLAYHTADYYKFLKPDKTLGIDLLERPTNRNAYPDVQWCEGMPDKNTCEAFLEGLDVVLCAETPYNADFFTYAREKGVKTVLVPNYEMWGHVAEPHLPAPDLVLASNRWYEREIQDVCASIGSKYDFMPMGVDRTKFQYTQRTEAMTFLHIAGRQTYYERNGTDLFFKAMPLVKNKNVRFVVRTQFDLPWLVGFSDPRLTVVGESDDNNLYDDADVLVMPRKYGGLCLPLNEAMSCGLVPLMTQCPPQADFLPRHCLLDAHKVGTFSPKHPIDIYETTPHVIAEHIDYLASNAHEVARLSADINRVVTEMDWRYLAPQYLRVFEGLLA